jgi:general stress protein YciG
MSEERRREIASRGGKAAHKKRGGKRPHTFTAEEARAAGRKGGRATSADREHMARIGSKGGKARREDG